MWTDVVLWCNLWVIALVVANANVTEQDTLTWQLCGDTICSIPQDCKNGICECEPGFELKEDGMCHICPIESQLCTECCFGETICYAGRCQRCYEIQNGECIAQTSLFFLTAAQVALATAMVIGVAALATLLYRTLRARSRNNLQPVRENTLSRVGSTRLSLTSIQIRVLRRLRDRPPKYETRHNYEFHQREHDEASVEPRTNTTPISQQTRADPILGAPPPSYDGDVTSLIDFPPPYSAEPLHSNARISIIFEQQNNSSSNTTEDPIHNCGIANRAFESTEGVVEGSSDINTYGNTKEKTIHI